MRKSTFVLGVLALAGLVSCNEDILVDNNGDNLADLTNGYEVLAVQEPPSATLYLEGSEPLTLLVCLNEPYDLTAGQNIDAGSVEVVNDGENLYVTFNTTGLFGTLHLWVGPDMLNLPEEIVNNQGVPVPGKFPYQFDASGLTHHTFVIPLSGNSYVCGTELKFVAHAEVLLNGNNETAFAGSQGGDTRRWYFFDNYTVQCCTFDVPKDPEIKRVETAYAKPPKSENGNVGYVFVGKTSKTNKSNPENYAALNLTQNRWGWAVNLKSFGTYTYPVYAAAGLNNTATGVLVGNATVEYDASGVKVSYDLGTTAVLQELHVYASDFVLPTIAPGQYGFTKYFTTPYNQSTFSESFSVSDSNGDGLWLSLHAVVGIF